MESSYATSREVWSSVAVGTAAARTFSNHCRCHCPRCCQHLRCHRCCYFRHHHCPLLLISLLAGCCVVVHWPLLPSHAVMRPSMLSLPAAFANNCRPPLPLPPPPQLPLPPGHYHCHRHRHRHHCGLTYLCTLTKKEAAAPPPPSFQLQHHRENVYKSKHLGLI